VSRRTNLESIRIRSFAVYIFIQIPGSTILIYYNIPNHPLPRPYFEDIHMKSAINYSWLMFQELIFKSYNVIKSWLWRDFYYTSLSLTLEKGMIDLPSFFPLCLCLFTQFGILQDRCSIMLKPVVFVFVKDND